MTPEQAKALLEAHGSQRKAAAAGGVSLGMLQRALRKLQGKPWGPAEPPAGFAWKGQSVLLGADGAMRQRWDKTKQEGMDPDDAVKLPDPKKMTKLSTMTDAEGRVIVQWVAEKPELIEREERWRAFAEELARSRVEPIEPAPMPEVNGAEFLMAGYPVADHHMGMLSWGLETGASYDLKIGEKLLNSAMRHLTMSCMAAGSALICFLGDFMHYDSFETVTPASKNMLDSDSRYSKVAWASVRVMRSAIDLALRVHRHVFVVVKQGNHDPSSSVFLELCIKIAYENEPRVTVLTSPSACSYFQFGRVLIGMHHGHQMDMRNLPMAMATDCPTLWGETLYRYWWTGHIHQSKKQVAISAQDYSGCKVESFRILPPPDAWGAAKFRPHRDMNAIIYHQEFGEVGRHIANPRMLEWRPDELSA